MEEKGDLEGLYLERNQLVRFYLTCAKRRSRRFPGAYLEEKLFVFWGGDVC